MAGYLDWPRWRGGCFSTAIFVLPVCELAFHPDYMQTVRAYPEITFEDQSNHVINTPFARFLNR